MNNKPSILRVVATYLAGCCLLTMVFVLPFGSAYYNWDLLAYTSGVMNIDEPDFNVVHRQTYEHVKINLKAEDFAILLGTPYERQSVTDATILQRRLPAVKTRPLYLGLMYVMWKAGLSTVSAGLILSRLPALLLLFLLYWWFLKYLSGPAAFTLAALFGLAFDLKELARLITPDGLCTLFVVTAAFCLIEFKSSRSFYMFAALSVLTRLDMILLYAAGLLVFFFYEKGYYKNRAFLALSAILFTILGGLVILLPLPGLLNVRQFMFLGALSGNMPLMPGESYASQFIAAARSVVGSPILAAWILIPFVPWIIGHNRKGDFNNVFLPASVMIYVLLRFALFPTAELRFYIPPFLILNCYYLIELLRDRQKTTLPDS